MHHKNSQNDSDSLVIFLRYVIAMQWQLKMSELSKWRPLGAFWYVWIFHNTSAISVSTLEEKNVVAKVAEIALLSEAKNSNWYSCEIAQKMNWIENCSWQITLFVFIAIYSIACAMYVLCASVRMQGNLREEKKAENINKQRSTIFFSLSSDTFL